MDGSRIQNACHLRSGHAKIRIIATNESRQRQVLLRVSVVAWMVLEMYIEECDCMALLLSTVILHAGETNHHLQQVASYYSSLLITVAVVFPR